MEKTKKESYIFYRFRVLGGRGQWVYSLTTDRKSIDSFVRDWNEWNEEQGRKLQYEIVPLSQVPKEFFENRIETRKRDIQYAHNELARLYAWAPKASKRDKPITCNQCKGDGQNIFKDGPCSRCEGKGKIRSFDLSGYLW